MTDAEKPHIPAPKDGETREVLVDDLEEASDYWLTITDAARVTRRQEITIRRWITAGELPVRRQRMGLNKRTRHVRASDLAKLTPIIDPTATITGAPANADLLSIPIQQAQLLVAQWEFVQRLTQFEQTLTTFAAQQERDRQAQELHQQEALQSLRQECISLLQTLQEDMTAQAQHLMHHVETQHEATNLAVQDVIRQVAQEAVARQTSDQELATMLMAYVASVQGVERITQQLHVQAKQERENWQRRLALHDIQNRQHIEETVEQLRTQMNEVMQTQLAAVNQAWQDRFMTLHMQFEMVQSQMQHAQRRQRSVETQMRQYLRHQNVRQRSSRQRE